MSNRNLRRLDAIETTRCSTHQDHRVTIKRTLAWSEGSAI